MKRFRVLALCAIASCTPIADQHIPTKGVALQDVFPVVETFASVPPPPSTRSNQEIAQDFLDLSFRMESGRTLPSLTRFQGPIKVRATGQVSTTMLNDLKILVNRLRAEANINISVAKDGEFAQITVEAIPKKTLQAAVPKAACFVVPRVSTWDEFQATRFSRHLDWTTLKRRDKATIFIPSDVAPQEMRDCLHEEVAQALGPLNDLYRLPDSVFNDDNIHTVLTSFDMLILKLYYSPYLQNGMTKAQVSSLLPKLLTKLNPNGQKVAAHYSPNTSREWIDAMQFALTSASAPQRRQSAVQKAIKIGNTLGWSGPRTGFAYYAHGRLQVGHDAYEALRSFEAAQNAYSRSPATQIHTAHIAVQQVAFALKSGDAQSVYTLTKRAIPIAKRHQNAALTATLMMFQAEALDLMGKGEQAQAIRLDSLTWARYGYGDETNIKARLNEISSLRPF